MSGYIGPIPVPQGIQNKESFTATAAQTTFNTNGYTDGAFISVYLNGVRLVNGTDYTATNGSDVVLASAANTGDVLDFETFNSFSLVSQTFDNLTTKNPTHEDTDGGRESALSFQGEQSGGEISTLAAIQASHDGTADDQKGDLIFKTNDGSDNNAPTERLRIDSDGSIVPATLGTDNVHLGEGAGASIVSGGNLNVAVGKNALTSNTTGDYNIAIGANSLDANTTADYNTAVGYNALTANTTGTGNVAVGVALGANTTANDNTAMGNGALGSNITGASNTAIGRNALVSNTASGNTAVGYNSLDANTSGNANTAVGKDTLSTNISGANNTAVGNDALFANTASNNTAVGTSAMVNNTSGDAGVAVGKSTLTSNTTGRFNTACGYEALYSNTTGGYSTAVGRFALGANTTGTYNTAVGQGALDANTTASSNVAVGSDALGTNTTGSGNNAVGNGAGAHHTTAAGGTYMGHVAGYNSNARNTCIGYLSAYSANGATSLTTGGGNTLIGAYTGVAAATNTGTVIIGDSATGKGSNTGFINPTSGVYQGNNQSVWAQTSDRRLKKNITDSSIGLAEINQLKVRNFEYKTKDDLSEIESDGLVEADIIDNSGVQVGAIAQEIQAVLPKCVTEQDTGVLSLNTDNLTWHLIKAVQELSAKNDALETENTAIKARLDALEAE